MTVRSDVNPFDQAKPFFPCRPVTLDFFTSAPQRFVTEVDLDCTPARLFAIMDDEASWPVWVSPGIQRVVWTSPRPHGEGTTRTVHMPGGLEVYEHFFLWNPGREVAFYLTGTTQKVWERFAERYEVTPVGTNGCRLRWTLAYEPAGGFARAHFLVKPFMALALRFYLRKLKTYVLRAGG
jgi:hypothetical protein